MTGPVARVREHLKEPLHRSSWSVMFSTVLMSGVGVLFWAIATRIYDKDAVGRGNALVFAMMLIASVFQMNMSNAAVRFLPQVRERLGLRIAQAYAIAASCSLIAAVAFAYIAPAVSSEYDFLRDPWWLAPLFAFSTALWAIFVVQDPVLMALGKATWMPPENFAHSAGKLLLLPLMFLVVPNEGLFVAWVLPLVVIVPVISWLVARIAVPQAHAAQRDSAGGVVDAFGEPRRLFKFMTQDFIGATATQVAIYATPLLTLALLGPAANAVYAMPFAAMTGLDLLFIAVLTSLTAEGARSPERIGELTQMVVHRLVRIQIPASLALVVFAPLLMLPFDPSYRAQGTEVARIIAFAGIFRAILLFYETVARLQGRGPRLLFVQVFSMVVLVALCFPLSALWGVNGIAASWLLSAVVTALAVGPWLLAFIRAPQVRVADVGEEALEEFVEQESKSPTR
jgi:O-antigen/teichoic acid export membrane protein